MTIHQGRSWPAAEVFEPRAESAKGAERDWFSRRGAETLRVVLLGAFQLWERRPPRLVPRQGINRGG